MNESVKRIEKEREKENDVCVYRLQTSLNQQKSSLSKKEIVT
jgi:hypothetical protein